MNLGTDAMDKYAGIDADLEAEFETGLEEETIETEVTEEVDETQVETTETEVDTEQETDEGEPSKEVEETPAHRAFAELRIRNRELEEAQAKKDKIIKMVMQGSGLDDEEEFIKALEQATAQQEQQALQMDDKSYATLAAERNEKLNYQKRLEETEAQLAQRNLHDFQNVMVRYEQEYGFTREEILNDLGNNGVTLDTIRASQNHDNLIKVNMIDKIIEARAKAAYEKELNRGTVDQARLSGTSTSDGELTFEEKQDALIEKEMQEYIKNKRF